MKLEEGQKQNLHDFVQLGSAAAGLMQADLATRLFALAVTYSDIAERHRIAAAETPTDWKSMWLDLKIQLDGNFTFTKDQEKNIQGIVRDIIIEPLCTVYSTMHIDVLAAIKKRPESLSLDNVAGVPAREQALASQVRSAGSSVRNALRKEILASIDPENWVSLPQFAYNCVSKYKLGGAGIDIPDTYTAHIALLCRFAFNHPAKGAQGRGHITTGEDFWGQVDKYFRTEIKTLGKSLIGPKWKSYVNHIISNDNAQFKGRKPGLPIEPVSAGQPEQAPECVPVGTGSMLGASTGRLASLL
ncbi:hypothetical protein B0H14DRAFT_2597338 [Mycena olivaceomarginata]|nr:hypothetical protein B0H14DRAFT_2597338 [Mycena olivaceomarginata]